MSFFDVFPTPKFLLLSSIGVALSDKSIRLIEFKPGGKHSRLSLAEHKEILLPEGAIVAGSIQDKEVVIKALEELRSAFHFQYARATLPEEKAYLFTTEVEKGKFENMRDAVGFTLEENVPLHLAEAVFDFDMIGSAHDGQTTSVAVAVLPAKIVEAYAEVFESAGITPVSFDIESQATARALIPRGDVRTFLILNVSESKTGLYIIEDSAVQFSSTLSLGARADNGNYPDLSSLKTEIRKLFAFWNTRLDRAGQPVKHVEHVIVSGNAAGKKDFVAELMSGFDIEYAVGNVWTNAFEITQYLPEISFEESLGYAAAIGAALPDKDIIHA